MISKFYKEKVDNIYKEVFLEIENYIDKEYSLETVQYPVELSMPGLITNTDKALFQVKQGSIKNCDVYSLENLIKNKSIENYLEIGSYLGVGFRIINEIFNPKLSFSIDPNIHHRIFHKPRNIFHKLNKKFNKKYVAIDDFWKENSSSWFNETKFDLIFIDGDHSYESVKRDFYECCKVLSNEGVILLHDVYSWKNVTRFVLELESTKDINVIWSDDNEYVDGFCAVSFN
jgi:hypothetical protein